MGVILANGARCGIEGSSTSKLFSKFPKAPPESVSASDRARGGVFEKSLEASVVAIVIDLLNLCVVLVGSLVGDSGSTDRSQKVTSPGMKGFRPLSSIGGQGCLVEKKERKEA